jgi:hypothetical protein
MLVHGQYIQDFQMTHNGYPTLGMTLMDALCGVMASFYRASGDTHWTPHSECLLWTRNAGSWPLLTGIRDDTHWLPNNQIDSFGRLMLGHGF